MYLIRKGYVSTKERVVQLFTDNCRCSTKFPFCFSFKINISILINSCEIGFFRIRNSFNFELYIYFKDSILSKLVTTIKSHGLSSLISSFFHRK